MTYLTDHFTVQELACRCGCGQHAFGTGFLEALERLRQVYGRPLVPISCCRCEAHNRAEGGHKKSLHMIGNLFHQTDTLAIDVKRPHGADLHRLIRLATAAGWSVGVHKTFVHLDWRRSIGLRPVFFTYD